MRKWRRVSTFTFEIGVEWFEFGQRFHTSTGQPIVESIHMKTIESKDPKAHSANIRGEFQELIQHLREDVEKGRGSKSPGAF
jgi:hypothetical protein